MTTRLNERKAAELKPRKQSYEVRDDVVRGLILRVGVKGQKVWEVVTPNGKTASGRPRRTRTRLGLFPDLSVKEARRAAETIKADRLSPGASRGIKTVSELFARYANAVGGRMRSFRDVESVWRIWAEPRIGSVRITDLNIYHGIDLRDHISAASSQTRASSALRVLRPMLSWAASEGYLPVNPWLGLKAGTPALERDRVLTEIEWIKLWEVAQSTHYPFGPWLQALMLSGQRLSNVAQMRWDEIAGDVWIIPALKMKATRPDRARSHEVPLSGALSDLIASQPRLGPYVFTTTGDKPIVPGSKLKVRVSTQAELTDWRWHDVRRTAATLMASSGVQRFVVERVLGHSDSSITAIYDRASYRGEKREALEILAGTVIEPLPRERLTNE
ncbi:tyrosine-type recombinase/integrase [Alisedimentitalea sp. MJ-SS2]|uniref:tyrosine-type recombinase/integrase n=1 Tax=Aliisedimentitalea sp. MJ-SS2 TaxID=3049795 RepID=UPI00290CADA6|nr:tyrosine-type recombinase/integrase [Alisedimentitalea sp. MJ-SS2]MDU8925934.1 tyrosine-type recombinase/integrase [Alisedimentitalea sp. MJ-SS2]